MDNLIENDELVQNKDRDQPPMERVWKLCQKAQYTPAYAFEKIFSSKQTEYIKVEKDIEANLSQPLNNAKAQCQVKS